ncbi:MAG: hypothetical protein GY758_17790 [Fuerstiella sp.]|nr:hypothetical protein [Fuerstiella sp.]MCP4787485.1 hypothetical protein [Fuerstiella sp.]MCP4859012.1 hypothetical protein [Fuerstiella sp.]
MALVEINWKPSDRQLRQFGGIAVVALPLLAMIWRASTPVIGTMAGIGAVVGVVSFLVPKAVKPLFIGLSVAAIPFGFAMAEVILISVFLFVFVPMGCLFRLMRRDALKLQKAETDSYWQTKRQPRNAASYFRQS